MSFRFNNPAVMAALVAAGFTLTPGDPLAVYAPGHNGCNSCHVPGCGCDCFGWCGQPIGPHHVAVVPDGVTPSAFNKQLKAALAAAGFSRPKASAAGIKGWSRRFHFPRWSRT